MERGEKERGMIGLNLPSFLFILKLSFLLMDLNEGILHVNTVLVYMGLRCFCAHRFLECISN